MNASTKGFQRVRYRSIRRASARVGGRSTETRSPFMRPPVLKLGLSLEDCLYDTIGTPSSSVATLNRDWTERLPRPAGASAVFKSKPLPLAQETSSNSHRRERRIGP